MIKGYVGQIKSYKLQNLVNICPDQFDLFRRNMEIGINRNKS